MIKKRILSMLALLMTAATGAWADEQSESFTTATNGQTTYTGEHFTITGQYIDGDGLWITDSNKEQADAPNTVTISSKNGENITRIEAVIGYIEEWNGEVASTSGNVTGTYANGQTITISSINATTVTLSSTLNNGSLLQFISWTIYYESAASATVAVTGVTLAPTSATLTLGETETVTLIPTVLPDDATDKSVTWSSSNEAVATVSNEGVVTAVAAGTATITVTTTDGAKTATCAVTVAEPTYTVTVKEGTDDATSWTIAPAEATTTGVAAGTTVTATYNGTKMVKSVKAKKKAAGPVAYKECPDDHHPHWIDLGLPSGTLWQCCNEGATAPEVAGTYYNYDEAMANTNVTLPTKAQIEELLDGNNTTSEWTTLNSVNGRWFTSKTNDGKVFLPAAGFRWNGVLNSAGSFGYYWSSTFVERNPSNAYYLGFGSGIASRYNGDRNVGDSVRPVR